MNGQPTDILIEKVSNRWRRRLGGTLLGVLALGACVGAQESPAGAAGPAQRPNFLIIVADDMAYSDIGAFGGEIDTPNLDRLAGRGVRFSDFHVAPSCSPTRAMLLTGNDSHVAGLGGMAEALRPQQRGQPGYEGHLNGSVRTIAERLHDAGYFTTMTGKWHLGFGPGQIPAARGFDRSFALMNGAANYYGKDQDAPLAGTPFGAVYFEDSHRARLPDGAYTTDYFASRLVDFLEENKHAGNRPFFAYLAFNAPHTPLQAPAPAIAKYKGRYDGGPAALRASRLARLADQGLVRAGTRPAPMLDTPDWKALPADIREESARRMEVYAAAVDVLDRNVGRVLQALERNGELDNTVILFLSDNGAEGNDENVWLDFLGRLGMPGPMVGALKAANGDPTRAGSASTYMTYGPDWAQAGMAPFSLTKSYTTEGGIRAPLMVAGPGVKGAGRVSGAFVDVMDIAPTLYELAGVKAAAQGAIRAPQGRSIVPQLGANRPAAPRTVGWELFGRQAIRSGPWKAVYQNKPILKAAAGEGTPHWSLYNLDRDPGETEDLAKRRPRVLSGLLNEWRAYAKANGVITVPQIGDPAGGRGPSGGS